MTAWKRYKEVYENVKANILLNVHVWKWTMSDWCHTSEKKTALYSKALLLEGCYRIILVSCENLKPLKEIENCYSFNLLISKYILFCFCMFVICPWTSSQQCEILLPQGENVRSQFPYISEIIWKEFIALLDLNYYKPAAYTTMYVCVLIWNSVSITHPDKKLHDHYK